MKKLIFLFILALFAIGSQAQHTLQFNRVVLVTGSTSVPTSPTCVWKVQSVLASNNLVPSFPGCGSINTNSEVINVGGSNITVQTVYDMQGSGTCSTGQGESIASSQNTVLPIWLPAGTTLAPGTNVQSISVLEFIVN